MWLSSVVEEDLEVGSGAGWGTTFLPSFLSYLINRMFIDWCHSPVSLSSFFSRDKDPLFMPYAEHSPSVSTTGISGQPLDMAGPDNG